MTVGFSHSRQDGSSLCFPSRSCEELLERFGHLLGGQLFPPPAPPLPAGQPLTAGQQPLAAVQQTEQQSTTAGQTETPGVADPGPSDGAPMSD